MLLAQTSPTVVFHTVSPSVKNKGLKETAYYDVNVEGTRIVLNACQDAGVRVFVYTSSTSVVWSGQNLSGPNEDEIQIPEKPYAIYAHSKALAEKMVSFLSRILGKSS
jgi:sterol-4alpha-carboxylate 3-dehydrogenase (decarboxylating)